MKHAEIIQLHTNIALSAGHDQAGWQRIEDARRQFLLPYAELFRQSPPADVSIGPGWWEPLEGALQKLSALQNDYPDFKIAIVQVKEKFGGLRLYCGAAHVMNDPEVSSWDEEAWAKSGNITTPEVLADRLHAIVVEAVAACAKRCEWCGEPGEVRPGGWIQTLCDKHAELKEKRGRRRG